MSTTLVVDDEFKSWLPPLPQDVREGLEAMILRDGCEEPIRTWNGIILDGHNRYEICMRHGIPFKTKEVPGIASREDAKLWIDMYQYNKRNLTPDANSYVRGRIYNKMKNRHGAESGGRGNQFLVSHQNDDLPKTNRFMQDLWAADRRRQHSESAAPEPSVDAPSGNRFLDAARGAGDQTRKVLAEKLGVSPATIERDGKFAEATEKLGIAGDVIAGRFDAPKYEIVEAAKRLPPEPTPQQVQEVLAELKKPHVANNSGNNEWYTPPEYIHAALDVMGDIDCDPASSEIANETVRARVFYSAEQDGRDKEWGKRVWMNPPYAQPLCGEFCDILAKKVENGEVEQAIVLVNNATETAWFARLISVASAVVFTRGRVRFLDPSGNASGAPLQGQAILYIGEHDEKFVTEFRGFGWGAIVARKDA